MTEEQINEEAEKYAFIVNKTEVLHDKYRNGLYHGYLSGYNACLEDNKNIAIAFQKWCLKKTSLEYFKDSVIWQGNQYTYEQLFNKFLKEYES